MNNNAAQYLEIEGDEEDRAWLDAHLKFGTKEEGCIPYFDFATFYKLKTPNPAPNISRSIIFTLGMVESVNILSAASLMEIGMYTAFVEVRDLQEHSKLRNAIQHAAWDCVVSLRRRMDPLSDRGHNIRVLKVPGRVIAAVACELMNNEFPVPWTYVYELIFHGILYIIHGHLGANLPTVLENANQTWGFFFGWHSEDPAFCDLYGLDIHPTVDEEVSTFVKFAKETPAEEPEDISGFPKLLSPPQPPQRSGNETLAKRRKKK